MAKSKRERYESERDAIRTYDTINADERDAIIEFLNAKDPERMAVTDPDDTTKEDGTLAQYAHSLKRLATLTEFNLTDTTATQLNRFMDDLLSGIVDDVKDDGLSQGTVKNKQGTLRKFYAYHDEYGVEKDEIAMFTNTDSPVDERDLLTRDEIHTVRATAEAFGPRDKALVDLFVYTGQRLSAILNLRVKDVDPNEGVFYLNTDDGDLKGASGKRPLLYAQKAVRDWLRAHPKRDDPEAHFITHKYDWENKPYSAGDKLDPSTVHRQLKRIGDEAGVSKPMNAHNFRHTFVTICKREYGMDKDTIKRLIGHEPDSDVMEKVYTHLTDDDVIAEAERATDLRDDEPESSLTPTGPCEVCGEPLPDDAKACPSCGTIITPDAQAIKNAVNDELYESAKQTDDDADKDALDQLKQVLRENPGLLGELTDDLAPAVAAAVTADD